MANGSQKLSRGEKKLFLVTGLAIALIFGIGAWRSYVNAIPDIRIPTPKMPSPNAYDFYVKAGRAVIPAGATIDRAIDSVDVPKSQWKSRYPTAVKEAWLRRNATALNLLRQGFKYPCRVPPQRSIIVYIPSFGSKGTAREMARLLRVESHARSERNNWTGAAQSALDILKMGHDIQRGALIDALVGYGINAIGRRELWDVLPHLNATAAKHASQRLEEIIQSRVPLAEVLREEKYVGQSNLLEIMHSEYLNGGLISGLKMPIADWKEFWRMNTTPRRLMFNNYTHYMDAVIANIQQPFSEQHVVPVPNDPYCEIVGPTYGRITVVSNLRDEAGNSLLLVALALRAYRLDHGHYPRTLTQLAPHYLKLIPADPFDNSEKLHYSAETRSGREYVLYSIGPDGVDNLGRPAIAPMKNGLGRHLILIDSKGDFVAGINY